MLPVVLVKRAGVDGPVRVDKSEYDANPSAFELWDAAAPVPPVVNKPVIQYLVTKVGRLHMVVDMNGVEVMRDGIDAGGYHSEADAWNAIAALKD